MCGQNWEQPTHRTKIQDSIDNEKPETMYDFGNRLQAVDMECIERIKAKRLERTHKDSTTTGVYQDVNTFNQAHMMSPSVIDPNLTMKKLREEVLDLLSDNTNRQ